MDFAMPTLIYGETRVNPSTNSFQEQPSVTGMTDGGYVLTWNDPASSDTDFIFAQRYNASGARVGGQTQINTTTAGGQEDAVVTALANGGYVVAWKSDSQNDDNNEIFTQLFNANGAKVGSEQQVNSNPSYDQDSPTFTALKDGGYLVGWASLNQDGNDWGAYLQRYNASGVKVGGETRINTTTVGSQDGPKLAGLADGGYMAVWEGSGSGDDYGIFAQRYNASGVKVGGETRINTTTTDLQGDTAITALANGGYVVSWQSYPEDHDNDDDTEAPGDIYTQLFNAKGVAVGGQNRVNTITTGIQEEPRILAMSDGGYLIAWNGNGSGDDSGIFTQRYNASGIKVGGETRVNTSTAGRQEIGDITALGDGGYLIAWESYAQNGLPSGIYTQRFDAKGNKLTGLTGDGLANTLIWSGTGSVIIDAGAGNDILTGGGSNDHLNGGSGNDTLNGGAGADRMTGGDGSDLYYVDNSGDIISETNATASTGGTDSVYSSLATYTLGANLESLTLTGTGAINGTGNSLNNTLTGNSADNTLNGAAGNDTLIGGLGNDTYVTDGGDTISETSTLSTEIDTVQSSVTYTLGANLENLALMGTGAINGTGNSLDNTLTGNSAANTLNGAAGNDTLNGGTGIDTLIGGLGNDTYYVDHASDVVSETSSSGGIDTVIASVSRALGIYQEKLTLSGTAAINGTGNSLANTLTGNGAANVLDGGIGNDILSGGAGKDVLTGGTGNDIFDFNALNETGLTSTTWDVINDLMRGSDKIDLSTLDANTATTANDAFQAIIGSTTAFTAAGQLKVASGVLYGNTDTDSTAEFAIQLVGVTSLATSDFVL